MIHDVLAWIFGVIIGLVILCLIGIGVLSSLASCDSLNARGKALHYSITGEQCK